RLIDEARALIAVDGVDASLEEIARRSDVGVATLYRNFPTRDDLGALDERMTHFGIGTRNDGQTLSFDDPWANQIRVRTA
ncbi:MAG TPA: helix-turn-helix domain-containing protein, partial [Cryobacterium sp.]|nr:helix-turn-helix domain-containing protein [Cryobacterium sp.]